MTDTAQLPCEREAFEAFAQNCPMGKYSITRRGDGYDSSHTQLMWDAWQARAQVQGEPVAWKYQPQDGIKHPAFTEHEAIAIAHGKDGSVVPLYTTPQPAQATQADVTLLTNMLESAQKEAQRLQKEVDRLQPRADVTDADIDAVTIQQWGDQRGAPLQAHRAYARAILALRPAAVPMTDDQWLEYLLKHANNTTLSVAASVGQSLQTRGRWVLLQPANNLRKLVERAYGITAQAKKETP